MSTKPSMALKTVTIRRARPEDAAACGRICYDAFCKINADHGFPPELPEVGAAIGLLSMMFSHPGFWCVVAEQNGTIVGSNCLDERSAVFGVGPITVDPGIQNRGIGRQLMQSVLDRSRERQVPSVRLLQSAFHNRSLSLYTRLGFDPREPMSLMQGPPLRFRIDGCAVRAATMSDLDGANRVCDRVHGHNRSGELSDAIGQGTARVVERQGRITGYVSAFGYFGHAVGESNLDLQALIAETDSFGGPGMIVPTRNAELFRWCLEKGLRVLQPITLMTIGLYNEPAGAYLPSILY
ncbi:MAG TPA: GNAT family N-acetyltransferase [Bryobacteraceae bacterium]|nr:GNAT family N-acetyltransferase [Bryobacteraceae bacterium]